MHQMRTSDGFAARHDEVEAGQDAVGVKGSRIKVT
jgi:hypothetical protein